MDREDRQKEEWIMGKKHTKFLRANEKLIKVNNCMEVWLKILRDIKSTEFTPKIGLIFQPSPQSMPSHSVFHIFVNGYSVSQATGTELFCPLHQTGFFQNNKVLSFSHPRPLFCSTSSA